MSNKSPRRLVVTRADGAPIGRRAPYIVSVFDQGVNPVSLPDLDQDAEDDVSGQRR